MIMKLKILVMLYEYLYWYVQLPLLSPVDIDWFFGVLTPALKCNCGFALIFFNFVILPFIFHKLLRFCP